METRAITQAPFVQTVAEPVVVGEPFSRRFWAYLIDFALLFMTNTVLGFVGGVIGTILLIIFTGGILNPPRPISDGLNWVTGIILSTLYFALYEWLYGATLGKVILRMRVVRYDGTRCGLLAALVRSVLRLVDSLFFGLVAYSSMKFPLYQRVGDKAAHTVVTSTTDSAIREQRSGLWFILAMVVYSAIVTIYYIFVALAIYSRT